MKITHGLIAAAAALMAAFPPVLAADGSTVKVSVNGMVCAFCAQGIEKRLTRLPEAGPLYINLAHRIVVLEPKPGQRLDLAKVKAEIVEAGYEVTQIETVPESVATLRAEIKARKK